MRNIYLLRHCETEHFQRKRCIGITDINLSKDGIEHARCLRKYFADKELNGIFCSDARRAAKTAAIISDGKIAVTQLACLHEVDMGNWDGMYFDDIKSIYPDEYKKRGGDFAGFSPPHGESFINCQKRAVKAFGSIVENSDGNIAIVSHAGFNRALICAICKINLNGLFNISQPFGCINILSVQNNICCVQKTGFEI